MVDSTSNDGLNGVRDVAISPDGETLYVVGYLDNALGVYRRDVATGRFTFVEVKRDGLSGVDGLAAPMSVVVSPDGKHVYAAGSDDDAVAVFSRNTTTGALTFVEAVKNLFGGVTGLDGPNDLAFSPGGEQLYVAAMASNAVTVFTRNATTGRLAWLESKVDGFGGVDGLQGASSLAVSPDGEHVYVGGTENAMVAFDRNPADGRLTYLATTWGGTGGVVSLDDLFAIDISPDGEHLYAIVNYSNALVVFDRNPATGALIHLETHYDDNAGVDGLAGAWALDVSPDGHHVYVAGAYDNAVSVFDRNVTTGRLSFRTLKDLLSGVRSVTVSPDGLFVYAGEYTANALTGMYRVQGKPEPTAYQVTLGVGAVVEGLNFGNVSISGEIRGTKWNDLDGDGQRDTGEPGLGNVRVYVDLDNDGQFDSIGEPSVLTASDGSYSFTGLGPGTYTVAEIVPDGWTQTSPEPGQGGIERVSAKPGGSSSNG
ncbi:MAG: beta-propeller fold lactonase family protein [Thermoguttaceae bacterium]